MAHSLQIDVAPRNRAPGVFRAGPKTHTPGPQLQQRGLRYYSPELGRWLSRDPIGELGFAVVFEKNVEKQTFGQIYVEQRLRENRLKDLLYVFTRNNPIGEVDYYGLLSSSDGCCGPDVTTPLDNTLNSIRNAYDNSWSMTDRWRACRKIYDLTDTSYQGVSKAWDVYQLFHFGAGGASASAWFGSGARTGTGANCDKTVAYHGMCYDAGWLNYIMWGVMNQRCNQSFWWVQFTGLPLVPTPGNPWSRRFALATATFYKAVIGRTPSAFPEVGSSIIAGWASSGGSAPTRSTHTRCAIDGGNRCSFTEFNWVWEPIQHRP